MTMKEEEKKMKEKNKEENEEKEKIKAWLASSRVDVWGGSSGQEATICKYCDWYHPSTFESIAEYFKKKEWILSARISKF